MAPPLAVRLLGALSLVVTGRLASASDPGLPWTIVLMTDAAANDGAVCLDGSPGAFYIKPGSGANVNKWILHLNGGGWCFDALTCYQRTFTYLGSSKGYANATSLDNFDLLNTNATENPDFAGYTTAWAAYCDGGSFAGDNSTPLMFNNTLLYFRGFRILRAMLDALLSTTVPLPNGAPSLADAESLILTGNSAGGLATILHADYVASRLPPTTAFKALPLVGFFINAVSEYGVNTYTGLFQNVALIQNISTGAPEQVNADCMAATPPQLRWQCFMAQFTLPFVKSPIFVQNSRMDNSQLRNFLCIQPNAPGFNEEVPDLSCIACVNGTNPAQDCNATQLQHFMGYGVQFESAFNMSVAVNPRSYTTNGAIVTGCDLHDHLINNWWNTIAVYGRSMREWVTDWLLDRTVGVFTYDVSWPNNPTCPGPL